MKFTFKTSLHQYEKKALVFMLGCFTLVASLFVTSAAKRGFFQDSIQVFALIEDGQGLSEGAPVKVAGRIIGYLQEVELREDGLEEKQKIRLTLKIFSQYSHFVREKSALLITRQNIIGEKEIEISGGEDSEPVIAGAVLDNTETFDFIAMLQSKSLLELTKEFGGVKQDMLLILREVASLVEQTQKAFSQINGKNLPLELLVNTTHLTKELNGILKEMKKANPNYIQDFSGLAKHLNTLSRELQVLTPVLRDAGPELPRLSKRLIEALDETVVLVKAMQKNYFLRSAVKDVKQKEKERDETERAPAAEDVDSKP